MKPIWKIKYFQINKAIQAWNSNTTEPVVNKIDFFFFLIKDLGVMEEASTVPIIYTI